MNTKINFQHFFDHIPEFLCIADNEGAIKKINTHWTNQLNYRKKDLLNLSFTKLIHPDDHCIAMQAFKHLIEHGQESGFIARVIKAEGSFLYLKWKLYREDDHIYCSATDITAQQRTEQEFNTLVYRYTKFLDATSDFVFIKDEEFRYHFINRAFRNELNLREEDIAGKTDFDLLPDKLASGSMESDLKTIRRNKITISRETFNERVFDLIKFPLTMPNGETGIGGFMRDISIAKNVEQAIRSREKFLSLLTDLTFHALGTADNETLFPLLTERLSELMQSDGCYITSWDDTASRTIPMNASNIPKEVYRGLPYVEGEITLTESVLKVGHPIPVEDVFNTPYLSRHIADSFPAKSLLGLPLIAGKEKLGAILIAFNEPHLFTTEEIQAGETVAGLIALIIAKNRLVEELYTLSNKLKINDAEKNRLFAIIAHDLKSPFNVILGLTEVLAQESEQMCPEENKKIITSMRNSAMSLFRLLENLLEWSRVKRGMKLLNPEVECLYIVIDRSLEVLTEVADKKEIILENLVPKEIIVRIDREIASIIIRNLVSNALKFTPRGGRIVIGSGFIEPGFIEIYVRDTGIGLPENMLGCLFSMDSYTRRPGTEGEPSSGLGLLLCKELVEIHGGKIRADSQEHRGSTFFFSLPYD